MSQYTRRAPKSAWLDNKCHIKVCCYYSDPGFVTEEQGLDPSGSASLPMNNGLSSLKPFCLAVFFLNKASCKHLGVSHREEGDHVTYHQNRILFSLNGDAITN